MLFKHLTAPTSILLENKDPMISWSSMCGMLLLLACSMYDTIHMEYSETILCTANNPTLFYFHVPLNNFFSSARNLLRRYQYFPERMENMQREYFTFNNS
jgi:hypothetical protein